MWCRWTYRKEPDKAAALPSRQQIASLKKGTRRKQSGGRDFDINTVADFLEWCQSHQLADHLQKSVCMLAEGEVVDQTNLDGVETVDTYVSSAAARQAQEGGETVGDTEATLESVDMVQNQPFSVGFVPMAKAGGLATACMALCAQQIA